MIAAAVLSVVLASTPYEAVTQFNAALKSGDAYALMSEGAQRSMGRPQFEAYLASRRRVLGAITGVRNLRPNDAPEVKVYEADLLFEKGVAAAWYVLAEEEQAWRVASFEVTMPKGASASLDESEVQPIVDDVLASVKSNGMIVLAERIDEKDLAEVGLNFERARTAMTGFDALYGPLESFAVNEAAPDDDKQCRTTKGTATFRDAGALPATIRLCWTDGEWRVRRAEFTPQLNPAMLERAIENLLGGKAKARCPRDAKFGVGDEIVCRVEQPEGKPLDATIKRSSDAGWTIVGLRPVE